MVFAKKCKKVRTKHACLYKPVFGGEILPTNCFIIYRDKKELTKIWMNGRCSTTVCYDAEVVYVQVFESNVDIIQTASAAKETYYKHLK